MLIIYEVAVMLLHYLSSGFDPNCISYQSHTIVMTQDE